MIQPRRDDDVAAWLKKWRDEYEPDSGPWGAIDGLLDEWRLRADTGTALHAPYPESH
jgi:hypothetical protein